MPVPDLAALRWPRRTERLLLRPATLDDVDAIQRYRGLPEFARYVTHDVLSRDDVVARVQERIDRSLPGAKEPGLGLAVEDADGRVVGDVMLMIKRARSIAGPVDEWEGVVGYGLHPEVHGRGYAAEVASELLAIGFGDLRLRRIRADAMRENGASNRVLEKVGLRLETTERSSVLGKDGRWLDRNVWAILREEWEAPSSR